VGQYLALCVASVLLFLAMAGLFLVRATVTGGSMRPSFMAGDQVLAVRPWVDRKPVAGDVVLARMFVPTLPSAAMAEQLVLKRVAAVGGEPAIFQDQQFLVPAGSLFLLGDASPSMDSSDLGPVRVDDVVGRVILHRRRTQRVPAD
jgi:hypothetical protein